MREQKGNPRLTLLVGCLAIVILAGCVAKFGVIDQYRRLDAAQAAYASVHTEYSPDAGAAEGLRPSADGIPHLLHGGATDGSEDNGTRWTARRRWICWSRRCCPVDGWSPAASVRQQPPNVAMSGMTLDQISRMFDL